MQGINNKEENNLTEERWAERGREVRNTKIEWWMNEKRHSMKHGTEGIEQNNEGRNKRKRKRYWIKE